MSRRLLLVVATDSERARMAEALDAAFDVDIDQQPAASSAVKLLPNRTYDLAIIHDSTGEIPGLDLVRFLAEHPLHRDVPVLFVGGNDATRAAAVTLGARGLLPDGVGPDELRSQVRITLGLG